MFGQNFSFSQPRTLAEAQSILLEKKDALLIAGGTDLIVKMKKIREKPSALISLKKIEPQLNYIQEHEENVEIGALTTLQELGESEIIRNSMPALSVAALSVGSRQVRSIATIGGNICNASPSADLPPGLLVLGANFEILGLSGSRTVSGAHFFRGPGQTCLEPGEILTKIIVPLNKQEEVWCTYIKHSIRQAVDIALVGIALQLTITGDRKVKSGGLALGAVAPTPLLLQGVDEILKDQALPLSAKTKDALVSLAVKSAKPIDDHRASARYRLAMVDALTHRALNSITASVV